MIATTVRLETATAVTLRAPALLPVAEALLALHEDPHDPRARIVAGLMHKEGLDLCPCCAVPFAATDVAQTRWSGGTSTRLSCSSCASSFVVAEEALC